MTPAVTARLTRLYGDPADAPDNLRNLLVRRPELVESIPRRAPDRWRQLSPKALEIALEINGRLIGPDGPVRHLLVAEAARSNPVYGTRPAPPNLFDDMVKGMGRFLKFGADTGKMAVEHTAKYAKIIADARKAREALQERQRERDFRRESIRDEREYKQAQRDEERMFGFLQDSQDRAREQQDRDVELGEKRVGKLNKAISSANHYVGEKGLAILDADIDRETRRILTTSGFRSGEHDTQEYADAGEAVRVILNRAHEEAQEQKDRMSAAEWDRNLRHAQARAGEESQRREKAAAVALKDAEKEDVSRIRDTWGAAERILKKAGFRDYDANSPEYESTFMSVASLLDDRIEAQKEARRQADEDERQQALDRRATADRERAIDEAKQRDKMARAAIKWAADLGVEKQAKLSRAGLDDAVLRAMSEGGIKKREIQAFDEFIEAESQVREIMLGYVNQNEALAARKAGRATALSEDEEEDEDEEVDAIKARTLVGRPKKNPILASAGNPTDEAKRMQRTLAKLQGYKPSEILVKEVDGFTQIKPSDRVILVGAVQFLVYTYVGPDEKIKLRVNGFTDIWRGSREIESAVEEIVSAALKEGDRQVLGGPDLAVHQNSLDFIFHAQMTRRGIIDNADQKWPTGDAEQKALITNIMSQFHATGQPASPDGDFTVAPPLKGQKVGWLGKLLGICYLSSREDRPTPYFHGFNPVFEKGWGNGRMLEAIDSVTAANASAGDDLLAEMWQGPDLACHQDGRTFMFRGQLLPGGIVEDRSEG